MELKPEIIEKIKLLDEKYASMGQDLNSYLEGLLHADFLTYWNYIHLDTLLSLQSPLTQIPDEEILSFYHYSIALYGGGAADIRYRRRRDSYRLSRCRARRPRW